MSIRFSRQVFHRIAIRPIGPTSCAFVRSLATAAPGPPDGISSAIMEDHRELEGLYKLMHDEKDTDSRARYQNQFVWLLAKHAIGEEIVVYPAYEKHMGKFGVDHAEKDRGSHQKIKDRLEYFQRVYPTSEEFYPKLDETMGALAPHIEAEEKDELPALEKALGPEASKDLAKTFHRTRHFLPTRSHPWAPNKPPFETVVALLATPVDKLGDMFRRFPYDEDIKKEDVKDDIKKDIRTS